MEEVIRVSTPFKEEESIKLKAGDIVCITGKIYTARDAAHARMTAMIKNGIELPFSIEDQIIYYTGPCPSKPGEVIGSAGPTTSGRMDAYTPDLLEAGLRGMIGKGERSENVIMSMMKHKAVYFAITGGTGALTSRRIKKCEDIAFPELGTESIKELWVEDLKCVVAIDAYGNDLYKSGRKKFERR